MTNKCLDEGTLQGYFDGELSPEKMIWAAAHLAECPRCDGAAREAEAELNLFTRAFAVDNSAKVPTERLRQRIDAALFAPRPIPQESLAEIGEHKVRAWLSSLASLAGPFGATRRGAPRWAGAMAGLAAVVLLGAVFVIVRPRLGETVKSNGGEVATGRPTPEPSRLSSTTTPQPAASPDNVAANVAANLSGNESAKMVATSASYTAPRKSSQLRAVRALTPVAERRNALLPGEDNYLKTINSLAKTIEANGDAALRPTARAEYERNLAVIDEAISESRRVARRHPQDGDAAAFLFSAYRNKVDLMSAVADQTQLAAFGR